MHELSIAQSLVELISDEARREGFSRVRRIGVRIGALGAVEPDALLFCFDVVAHGTIAEGAELTLETVPGAGWCPLCRATMAVAERYALCPRCGQSPVTLTAGDELRLVELEVE